MEVQKEKTQAKPKGPSKQIQELIDIGVPLKMAVFHRAILSYGTENSGTPETALWSIGGKPMRTAKLWYTPHGLVTEQRGIYKIIPLANVSDTTVL